jgi:hypothetical protein
MTSLKSYLLFQNFIFDANAEMRRAAGATPGCKRTRGQKRSVSRPPRDANGHFERPKCVARLEMP